MSSVKSEVRHPIGNKIPNPKSAGRRRGDIQALRALAVAAVIVYHFWPWLLPGGFVGVDVFFVISGFLITGHLVRELQERSKISLKNFYARRIKRILPSAYIVAGLSALLTPLLLPLSRWENVTREGLATIVYVQNILLARDSVDYLAEGTPESPFRHYWSLSVEEQFYIVLPLVLILGALVARKRSQRLAPVVFTLLAALFVASFVHAILVVGKGDPAAYFLLSTRMWELLAGSLLALGAVKLRLGHRSKNGIALLGWTISIAAVALTSTSQFPGWGAIPAVLGTSLVIGAHSSAGSKLIDQRGVQYIGDISYNLYLTHWPVLIFLPFLLPKANGVFGFVAVVISVLAAAVLYRYVDRPLASYKVSAHNAGKVILMGLGASILVAGIMAIPKWAAVVELKSEAKAAEALIATEFQLLGGHDLPISLESPFKVSPQIVVPVPAKAKDILPSGADGRCKSAMSAPNTPTCLFGPTEATTKIVLAGDSHMEQYLPAFELLAQEHDIQIQTYFHSSCPLNYAQRMSDFERGGPCQQANLATLESLKNDPTVDLIVTSNRTAVPWVSSPDVPGPVQGFVQVWDELEAAGKTVVVLQDSPLMLPGEATTECVLANLSGPETCSRPRSQAMPVDHQLEAAKVTQSATLVRTEDWFCTQETCPAVIGNVLVFRDEQHISVLYVQTLAQELWAQLRGHLTGI